MRFVRVLAASAALLSASAIAQQSAPTAGTLVIVPAYGTVKQANDQAQLTFSVEEADKDKNAAASRVNQHMKDGIALLKREDPQAVLRSVNYYTYPVYPEDQPVRPGMAQPKRVPTSWRAGQSLEYTTTNLTGLAKTAAAAQNILSLNGVHFSLTDAAAKKLDERRIAATYQNLTERIAAIARTMGRPVSDAMLEIVDFEGSGNYAQPEAAGAPMMSMRMNKAADSGVEQTSFEPGETTLQMRVVGKVRFK
ncbi:MAG TPA: SIMPL domain-containing protein [Burkholderiaceae bacterium]